MKVKNHKQAPCFNSCPEDSFCGDTWERPHGAHVVFWAQPVALGDLHGAPTLMEQEAEWGTPPCTEGGESWAEGRHDPLGFSSESQGESPVHRLEARLENPGGTHFVC